MTAEDLLWAGAAGIRRLRSAAACASRANVRSAWIPKDPSDTSVGERLRPSGAGGRGESGTAADTTGAAESDSSALLERFDLKGRRGGRPSQGFGSYFQISASSS
jgi:hypothetical protein